MAYGFRCADCGYQEAEHEGALAGGLTTEEMKKLYPDLMKCKGYRLTKEDCKAEKREAKEDAARRKAPQEYGGYYKTTR